MSRLMSKTSIMISLLMCIFFILALTRAILALAGVMQLTIWDGVLACA